MLTGNRYTDWLVLNNLSYPEVIKTLSVFTHLDTEEYWSYRLCHKHPEAFKFLEENPKDFCTVLYFCPVLYNFIHLKDTFPPEVHFVLKTNCAIWTYLLRNFKIKSLLEGQSYPALCLILDEKLYPEQVIQNNLDLVNEPIFYKYVTKCVNMLTQYQIDLIAGAGGFHIIKSLNLKPSVDAIRLAIFFGNKFRHINLTNVYIVTKIIRILIEDFKIMPGDAVFYQCLRANWPSGWKFFMEFGLIPSPLRLDELFQANSQDLEKSIYENDHIIIYRLRSESKYLEKIIDETGDKILNSPQPRLISEYIDGFFQGKPFSWIVFSWLVQKRFASKKDINRVLEWVKHC